MRKEFNPHVIFLYTFVGYIYQYGCRDVMWKRSIVHILTCSKHYPKLGIHHYCYWAKEVFHKGVKSAHCFLRCSFTALFKNTRILKFESQLTFAFSAAFNHLSDLLNRKQKFTSTDLKRHGLWFVIGGFRSVLCVSLFQGSLFVIVIMIDGSEKCNSVKAAFENQSSRVFEKHSKFFYNQVWQGSSSSSIYGTAFDMCCPSTESCTGRCLSRHSNTTVTINSRTTTQHKTGTVTRKALSLLPGK